GAPVPPRPEQRLAGVGGEVPGGDGSVRGLARPGEAGGVRPLRPRRGEGWRRGRRGVQWVRLRGRARNLHAGFRRVRRVRGSLRRARGAAWVGSEPSGFGWGGVRGPDAGGRGGGRAAQDPGWGRWCVRSRRLSRGGGGA